ncbi:phospholipase D family protein [Variovorax paradoxus]|uniref:Putative cardiolipin synthase YwiE n=1 Tax=Variovorax paradoxus TaxID=34073 RepID=A0A0H2M102_VARPD|nr:phospholipase D family protein [Variovorax paradoxus]KLN56099.1 putative cardiolipin synthase YwiE [Variovorax paradoxus]
MRDRLDLSPTGIERRSRRSGMVGRCMLAVAAALLAACTSLALDVPRVPSHAFDQPLLTSLGRTYFSRLASAPGQSGFHLLVSGPEAFAARGALAAAAERSLDLQYYSVADDSTATLLLDGVLRAAQRGVRVRLLVDDLNVGDRESHLAMLAAHPNVEVRLFNPFSQRGSFGLAQVLELLGDGERLNRRMHNKLWIADGAVAVMGGRNLGNAYFNASQERDFADLDVLAAGPVVADVSRSFDRYWNSRGAVPIAAVAGPVPAPAELRQAWAGIAAQAGDFRESDYVRSLRKTAFGSLVRTGQVPLVVAPAEALSDVPVDPFAGSLETTSAIFPVLRKSVEKARHEVILVSPYLVPGATGVQVLCGLARRGVRVRILTNSLASTDVPVVHAGYARYRPQMLACGVALYELRPGGPGARSPRLGLSSGASLHAKAVVVDGEAVFIGSMNLDPRSSKLNTEVALRIESQELGRQLTALFGEATTLDQVFEVELDEPGNAASSLHWQSLENDRPVRYSSDPLASAWRVWMARFLGGLAPEELL